VIGALAQQEGPRNIINNSNLLDYLVQRVSNKWRLGGQLTDRPPASAAI
jgi:hypothetical protein